MPLADIRAALDAELAATPEFYDFKVLRSEPDGPLWRITLEPGYVYAEGRRPGETSALALLDDSLDGSAAWWGAPVKGGASVLAVVPESDQLVLQNASVAPPGPDHLIRLYPTRFLQPVADAWWDTPWAEQALAHWPRWADPPRHGDAPALTGEPFRWLRPAQRQALGLVGHRAGFLWGPPGTGKTTTLGVLLAEYLARRPEARVLLLSTTNAAVDTALIAVDKALAKGRREGLRPQLQRLGTRLQAAAYVSREHLVPGDDGQLIARLARAEAQRPASRDAQALKAWADRVATLREALKAASLQVLRRCRLAAMTTARAAWTLRTLRELAPADGRPPFDLLVFDEASQVSLAHALVLAPLGAAVLFAGDPQQLSPVLRSEDRLAQRWLGRSAFSQMPPGGGPAVVRLDEQSRMAEPISELVSDLFYDGALRVADDARADPAWQAVRQRPFGPVPAATALHIEPVARDGHWSSTERGPVRAESAARIRALLVEALADEAWPPQDIIVLTPFRAQRARIRQQLLAAGLPETLRVSTVHRAQGSEAPVVIFDPVDGAQPFLQTEEARRLVNVALSRAQAKLIVLLSAADRANPMLAPIVQRERLAGDVRPALPLQQLAAAPGFPHSAIGQRVSAGRLTGEISGLSADGRQLILIDARSGAERALDVAFWRAKAGPSSS
ncbi:MAG: hypothetical protein RL223_2789 [Pseudomonadota bacterium]|jgi:hypothetical protein